MCVRLVGVVGLAREVVGMTVWTGSGDVAMKLVPE